MSIVMRCRHGMDGCTPLTNEERAQRYAIEAARRVDPLERAVRAAAGLQLLARLAKFWKRKKRPRKPVRTHKKSNVVPLPLQRRA